jgi:membrane-associated phospholipid phosphatase
MHMNARQLLLSGAVLTLLTLLAIFTGDVPLAMAIAPSARANHAVANPFMTAVEYAFLFPLSKWATGFALLLASAVFFALRRGVTARLLLFVAATELVSRLLAGVLKNVFLRARPYETNAGTFFVDGGSAFPSGHAAHFWALFFALAVAFPRLRIPALILAVLVSIARVMVNDHFAGDVLGSAAIAAFVGAALIRVARSPRAQTTTPSTLPLPSV